MTTSRPDLSRPDLSRLSEAERHVLGLLAQGHTAKSIAAAIGRSEGAVNERLREARRKTGVGSSRELARLLAQENRDEIAGVAPPLPAAPEPPGAPIRARWSGMLLMSVLVLSLALATLVPHATVQEASPTPPAPPAPGVTPDEAQNEAAQMRLRFAGEKRDVDWAKGVETALWRRYHAIAGADLATLVIACRATLCEVRGQSVSKVDGGAGKRIVEVLGSPMMRRSIPGLHADVTDTSSFVRAGSTFVSFDAIWRRVPG